MTNDEMIREAGKAFGKQGGLIPAIVQDAGTGEVLMLAYMDEEALRLTLTTGDAWFFSRSRGGLWRKGETSGNTMKVLEASLDCDSDTILLKVRPAGPACHTGARSCFTNDGKTIIMGESEKPGRSAYGIFERLDKTVQERLQNPSERSYTTRLLKAGTERVLRKVAEESGEFIIAVMKAEADYAPENRDAATGEMADLIYHSAVAMASIGLSLGDAAKVLEERHGRPAAEEKLNASKV